MEIKINSGPCFLLRLFIFFGFAVLSGNVVSAQGFGRNKVIYEKFDFHVLTTTHYSIHTYLDSSSAQVMAQLSERWYSRFEKIFMDTFNYPLPLIFYNDHPDFQQTEVISGLIDPGTGGVTEGFRNRLIMPLAGSYAGTDHVLGHEMTHVFQYHLMRINDTLRLEEIYNVPLWMIEGMAEYCSLGPSSTLTSMWMRDALLHNDIPTLKTINYDYHYNPYRFGHAIWSFIAGHWGDSILPVLFLNTARYGFEPAIRRTLMMNSDSLSSLWAKSVREIYGPAIRQATKPYAIGKSIMSFEKQGGEFNLSPSISPDGSKVVFFSEKDIFSIDIFLADTKNGKIIRKLGEEKGGSRYDELNFIASSGSWSPGSDEFAFSVYSSGNQKIVICNAATGEIVKEFGFPEIGSVFNIAWSPDGKTLAFSGTNKKNGATDLYLYNLERDSLKQITNDWFADLHPCWSPDGTMLAFVSDRGVDTDFSSLVFGKMFVCIYSISERSINIITLFSGAQHINPQFSADGHSLFFISDPDGISNIYRYDLNTFEIFKITNVATGVSGLTDLSPAFSTAMRTGEMVFTVFDNKQFRGYILTSDQTIGVSLDSNFAFQKYNLLPPLKRKDHFVMHYLDAQASKKNPVNEIKLHEKYKARLGLEYIGGVYAGVGLSQYGMQLQGGAYFRFTDILNRHVLATAIQVSNKITDVAILGLYINQTNRFHWGAYASHIPYLSSSVNLRLDTITVDNSQTVVTVIDQVILRSFEDRIALLGSYPLSMTRRFDFQIGETFLHYTKERTTYFPFDTPVENLKETVKLLAPSPLHYTNVSIAYVGDNSFFAITDPMKGYRYRIQVEGIFNSFAFVNILADYRKYYFIKPFSFAFRLLHFGRYFNNAEDSRLPPVFLGNEYLIHGYSIYSFRSNECDDGEGTGTCAAFERLLGSKIAVMNMELRLPFTGPGRLALIKSRIFYSSINIFLDGGTAWWKNDLPLLTLASRSAERIPVFSTGVSYRINISGVFVIEIYGAYPFQRPERGWHFGFQIMPGW